MKKNFKKVLSVFKKNYHPIPLEIFGNDPYKTLISTVLSSRTNDTVTLKSSQILFEKAGDLKKLDKLSVKEIEKLIYPVGFYKTKAKYLKNIAAILLNKHKGQVPSTRDDLIALPGVGRKTANLVLNRTFSKPAISVDTHVHKIANLLGWVKTKTPENTEKELIKILPRRYWKDINRLFVSIGRQYNSDKKLKDFLKRERL